MTSQQHGAPEMTSPLFLASPGVAASPLHFPWLLMSYRRPIPYFHRLTPSSGAPLAFNVHLRSPQRPNPFYLVFPSLIQYLGVPMIIEGAGASHHTCPPHFCQKLFLRMMQVWWVRFGSTWRLGVCVRMLLYVVTQQNDCLAIAIRCMGIGLSPCCICFVMFLHMNFSSTPTSIYNLTTS